MIKFFVLSKHVLQSKVTPGVKVLLIVRAGCGNIASSGTWGESGALIHHLFVSDRRSQLTWINDKLLANLFQSCNGSFTSERWLRISPFFR